MGRRLLGHLGVGRHFVLFDDRGHLRGYYDSDDWGRVETLMRHARWLAHHPQK